MKTQSMNHGFQQLLNSSQNGEKRKKQQSSTVRFLSTFTSISKISSILNIIFKYTCMGVCALECKCLRRPEKKCKVLEPTPAWPRSWSHKQLWAIWSSVKAEHLPSYCAISPVPISSILCSPDAFLPVLPAYLSCCCFRLRSEYRASVCFSLDANQQHTLYISQPPL